jgi:hypothetical protein
MLVSGRVRRDSAESGRARQSSAGRVRPIDPELHQTHAAQTKKRQLSLPFSNSALAVFSTNYFFAENAANFLLNFSTRPAVSMIF